jgi:hypothetical protein
MSLFCYWCLKISPYFDVTFSDLCIDFCVGFNRCKMDLQEVGGGVGTGWIWLRIGTGDGHL